ncbi:MAG: hypothetical protein LQ346_006559 [Caloplaca aetnensis]|nr:MAG: hypothetical protein LQ346_006559 [Caloplaca aetnensis]
MASNCVDKSTQTDETHHPVPATLTASLTQNPSLKNDRSPSNTPTVNAIHLIFTIITTGLLMLGLLASDLFHESHLFPKSHIIESIFAVLLGFYAGIGVGLAGRDMMVGLFRRRRRPCCDRALLEASRDDDSAMMAVCDELEDDDREEEDVVQEDGKEKHERKRDFQIWDDEAVVHGGEWPVGV